MTHARPFPWPLRVACGQLILGGFEGRALPPSFARALAAGERGGAILFRRNVGEPREVAILNAAIAAAAPSDLPALIAVDQEGGRVARLRAPLLVVPPMREVARRGGPALVRRVARVQ